jgi:arsenite-transporting ATPase
MDGGGNPLAGMLGEEVADPLAGSMPGADEAAAIRLLLEYLDDPRFERVVVDTAPTGHTLRLLELPEMLDSMMGKLVTFRERMSGMFDMFGDDAEEEDIDSLQEFSARIERLRGLLRDPALTDFRLVMVPEELSVMESERMLDRLDAFDVPVGTVVVNRVMQDPTEVTDLDPDWFVAPNHADCEFCARRWEVQQRALARSQDIFRGHDVRRVPLFAEEVRGEKLLHVVAACLEA